MRKKISLIGTNGIPSKYGGFETLTEYLAKYLSLENDVTVYCSKTPRAKRLKEYNGAKLFYLPLSANGWQSMLYDALSIIHAFFVSDVLIILGFSGVFAFPLKVVFRSKRIVFNIGGIEWQKVRGTKKFAKLEIFVKKWFEKICVRFSDLIVVDNSVLYDYVRLAYNIEPKLIEYGGDHANYTPTNEFLLEKYNFLKSDYDVSVSRAQEDMNIHVLLEAYEKLPERKLVVISNWNTSDYGLQLKYRYQGKFSNIILLDAVYNLSELNTIRSNAKMYFHSHSLCGTAPSLTEAMSIGLPVICFDVPTNRATTEEKSFYFNNAEELIKILSGMDNQTTQQLGLKMQEIARRRYTWDRISKLYAETLG